MSRATTFLTLVGIAILTGCSDEPTPTAPRVALPPRPNASLAPSEVTVDPPVILDGFSGSSSNMAHGINGLGDIVGESNPSSIHATLWSSGKTSPQDLGLGRALDINDAGQVVGQSGNHAALWTPDGRGGFTLTNIGADLPGSVLSTAYSVNNKGQIVGSYRTLPTPDVAVDHCFLWTPAPVVGPRPLGARAGTVTTLEGFGGAFCTANDINSAGYIVGASDTPPDKDGFWETHGFVWSPSVPNGTTGSMQDLTPTGMSYATAINDARQVAGQLTTETGANAAVWTPVPGGNYDVTDLGPYTGQQSWAIDINDAGFVIGFTSRVVSQVEVDAFFWRNGAFSLLSGLTVITSPGALMNVRDNRLSAVGLSQEPESVNRTALRWDIAVPSIKLGGCLADLIHAIEQMRDDRTLRPEEARSLSSRLEAASQQIDQRRSVPARYLIETFVGDVKALVQSGRLSQERAQPLFNLANCVIEGL